MRRPFKPGFVFVQLSILALTVAIYQYASGNWPGALVAFLSMQIGSLIGSWWGAHVGRRMQRSAAVLPIRPR